MAVMHPRVRPEAVAGRFYEADPARCAAEAQRLCAIDPPEPGSLPQVLHGAVVPHAGWICSGRVAGRTLAVLARHTEARTIVITGSVHTIDLKFAALDSAASWRTPLGAVEVDDALRRAMAGLGEFEVLDAAHEREHALEVQLPFIRTVFGPAVRVVPVMIPPIKQAVRWGAALGELLAGWAEPVVMVASSDLTHYGPSYRFTPQGVGLGGIDWAHEVNDRHVLDRIEAMDAGTIVAETQRRKNACGGGAIAATIAACRALGATAGCTLEHTSSQRELEALGHADGRNSVGYAGVVFG